MAIKKYATGKTSIDNSTNYTSARATISPTGFESLFARSHTNVRSLVNIQDVETARAVFALLNNLKQRKVI